MTFECEFDTFCSSSMHSTVAWHRLDMLKGFRTFPRTQRDGGLFHFFRLGSLFTHSIIIHPSHKNRHRKKRAAATDKRLQPEIPRTCSPFSSRLKYSGNSLSSFFVLCFFLYVANKKTHEMIFPRFRLRSDENVCFSQLRRQNGISAQRDGN